jgi:hypothetical protein
LDEEEAEEQEQEVLVPVLADFKGIVDIQIHSAIIVHKPFPGSVSSSCQESRGCHSFWHDMDVRLPLRSEGAEHGASVVDWKARFPHTVDASKARDDVVPHCEHELELVTTAFF